MRSLIFLLILLPCSLAFAETQIITLKDGSQVKGELTGINDGTYTIKTPLMGDVQVSSSEVTSISAEGAMPAAQPAAFNQAPAMPAQDDMSQKIQSMQNQLMANPAYLADIQEMMQDPEIAQIMADPEFVQAITTQNFNAVQSSPRTQELMNNPKMRAFIEKMRGGSQPSPTSDN